MSMAVVCANLSWLSYSNGASSLVFQPQRKRCGDEKGYTSLACQASSGGSRRDYEKILARQKNRRVRHMKGVTPSTPDLINTLESEKRDQAKLDSQLDGVNDDEQEHGNVEDEEQFEDSDTPDIRPA